MGLTLWIHTLEGRSMSKDSDDHSLMHRFSDELDAICAEQGLPALSSFFDFTDLNFNMADEFDEEGDDEDDDDASDDEPAADPETGLGYGIDDMQWFDASAGLRTIRGLREALGAGSLAKLKPAQRAGLVEELENCASILEATSRNAGRFHLAVIM